MRARQDIMTDKATQKQRPVGMSGLQGPAGRIGSRGQAIERAKNVRGALRRLMHYLRPYRNALVLVTLTAGLGTAFAIAGP